MSTSPTLLMFDHNHGSRYGAARCMLALAKGADREGWKPIIATGMAGPLTELVQSESQIPTLICDLPDRLNILKDDAARLSLFRRIGLGFAAMRYAWSLKGAVESTNPQVLYANNVRSVLYLLPSKWLLGRPLVWAIQLGRKRTFVTALVSSVAALAADRIMTISEAAVRQSLPRLVCWLTKGKIAVNYAGIDVDRYERFDEERQTQIRRNLGIPAEPVLLTMVGSLTFRKGLDVLVAAVRRLHRGGSQIHVAVAGTADDVASQEFFESVKDAVYSECLPVTFLGWVENIPELMGSTDIFVLPSREEGLGRAILEAMASYVPPIVTIAGGSEETVIEGESGFRIKPDDVDQLTVRIQQLAEDPELRQRMGMQARRRCETVFSELRYQDDFVLLLDGLYPHSNFEAPRRP
jgi:glycosyltransferase involved in cell wall biosynthesis